MKAIKWGILATGNIANSLAQAIIEQPDAELLAVGSRTLTNAGIFADKWQIPRHYGRYETLVANPNIDVVYIATPHHLHAENIKLCLNAGKHVLCEKPLTVNALQTKACMELAKEKNLFLMEAMWMRFLPAIRQMMTYIAEG